MMMLARTTALLVLVATVLWSEPAHAQGPQEPIFLYVVQDGDFCKALATRFYGNARTGLRYIHKYNPQLGSTPHDLTAGMVLKLPIIDNSPDARLAAFWGAVRARSPSDGDWRGAIQNMDLFRAWRVGSQEESSAKIKFKDDSQIFMREQTVVIIYGGTRTRSKTVIQQAELESGALRARLGELSGRKDPSSLQVMTPTGQANMDEGEALMSVDEKKVTRVANHGNKPVRLKGRKNKTRSVTVGPDMGSKVTSPGANPTKPKPLPPIPKWKQTAHLFGAVAGTGVIKGSWVKVDKAKHYRLEVWEEKNGVKSRVVFADEIPSTQTDFSFKVAPGQYKATLASIDDDKFESRPTKAQDFEVVAIKIVTPNTDKALAGTVWMGSELVAPEGSKCTLDGSEPASRIALKKEGTIEATCTQTDGTQLEPMTINVKRPKLTLDSPEAGFVKGQKTTLKITADAGYNGPIKVSGDDKLGLGEPKAQPDGSWLVEATPLIDAPSKGAITVQVASAGSLVDLQSFDVSLDDAFVPVDDSRWKLELHAGYGRVSTIVEQDTDEVDGDDNPITEEVIEGADAVRLGLSGGYILSRSVHFEADLIFSLGLSDDIETLHSISYRGRLSIFLIDAGIRPYLVLGAGAETFLDSELGTVPMGVGGLGILMQRGNSPVGLRLEGTAAVGSDDVFGIAPVFDLRMGVSFAF